MCGARVPTRSHDGAGYQRVIVARSSCLAARDCVRDFSNSLIRSRVLPGLFLKTWVEEGAKKTEFWNKRGHLRSYPKMASSRKLINSIFCRSSSSRSSSRLRKTR
jgi:hypothetical protein